MEWPLGRFSAGVHGEGRDHRRCACGIAGARPRADAGRDHRGGAAGEELGAVRCPPARRTRAGRRDFTYRFDPEWVTIDPSRFATPRTFVSFEGRTAWGERSRIPFHVTSADWQESDRAARRHHDRVRLVDRCGAGWRLGRVRRHDDRCVQASAHRRALPRRADARVGRRSGAREPRTSSSRTATSS